MKISREELANAIRALSMDAVQQANAGHPGMPMGMANIAEVLWRDFLKHNPKNPDWFNRDRFILSNGHGAMLQYALLHLTGYNLGIEDLKNFRQLHSRTPGHPEYGDTPGVETTTGPLGQGLANAVGMALAEKLLAQTFNRENFSIVDHYTYVFLGDGCLMEGISHEVCSLAGTWGLGKLIAFWDDNGISIDGDVKGWFTDDTPKRFAAYGWQVIANVDGHDPAAIQKAIKKARKNTLQPTLICCRTTIGFGSPNKAGTAEAHGSPLGAEEIALVRKQLNWNYPPFVIPPEIYSAWDACRKGKKLEKNWQTLFESYAVKYPVLASEFVRRIDGQLPKDFLVLMRDAIHQAQEKLENVATRKASEKILNVMGPILPELLGGCADLTGSVCTWWKGAKAISHDDFSGNYLGYGVREFGMSAIMNGVALHKGFIPYGGTFLTFSDYARNAVRLSALMKIRVVFVYSHDSIGLGEDGPTHQPIEHAAMLRMTPGLQVWRPCDVTETAVAWRQAITHDGPSCLLLTRQNVPAQKRNENALLNIECGAYILLEPTNPLEGIFIATGSEVSIAVAAAEQLNAKGRGIRVVSMPCCEVFKSQDADYREKILPSRITARVAIEAGVPDYWFQFVGLKGKILGISRFGLSAPAPAIYKEFGLTAENAVKLMSDCL